MIEARAVRPEPSLFRIREVYVYIHFSFTKPLSTNPFYTKPQTDQNQPKRLFSPRTTKSQSNAETTLGNGYLGSRNDEERSEMRYVMRIAELSESSNL